MKRVIIISVACLGYSILSTAQTIPITDLEVPSAPGFVLLDKAPASVEKPTSPKAFGISILNALKDNQGAIEVTPYWLWNHPALTFSDALKQHFPLAQTFNISGAVSQNDTGSFVSAGFRVQLVRVYSKHKWHEILHIDTALTGLLSVDRELLEEDTLKALGKELGELRSQSTFNIELAGALAAYSPDNKFSTLANNRYGIWLNLKWQPYWKTPLSLVGVARYSKTIQPTEISKEDSAFFDGGIALSYQNNSFDLQLEYVYRNDIPNGKAYDRTTFIANYMVADNLVIVASLGKNFDNVQDIFAAFGLKFGLSKQKISP